MDLRVVAFGLFLVAMVLYVTAVSPPVHTPNVGALHWPRPHILIAQASPQGGVAHFDGPLDVSPSH